MLLLLVIVWVVAFVVFFKRAGQAGEKRKLFWGLSGAAIVIGPWLGSAVIWISLSLFGYVPGSSGRMFINVFGVLCLIGGFLLGKWMLDRFLPIARQPLDVQNDEVIEDE